MTNKDRLAEISGNAQKSLSLGAYLEKALYGEVKGNAFPVNIEAVEEQKKSYNNQLEQISTALDGIIALQNGYIGG